MIKTPARTETQVKNMKSEIEAELDKYKNEPSLVLYKSQPTSRADNDIYGHFGDYGHAKDYFDGNKNDPQKMMKFTLKPGAQHLLFNPKYMALAPTGVQHRPIAALSKQEGKKAYPRANSNEGFLGGYIGLKAEGKNGFSLGIAEGNKASRALFDMLVEKTEVGRPGQNG